MKSTDLYPWLKKISKELLLMPTLPNTLILEGNPGLGKAELALDLIQRLLCQKNSGCEDCQSCLLFKENTHPEFHLVDLEENKSFISIDQIRKVIDFMNLTVAPQAARVVLILNADRLNKQSQNGLLKTLEESSLKKYIYLVANSRNALLPTIYSRCFVRRIPSPSTSSIDAWLSQQGIINISANDFPSFYSPKLMKTMVESGKSELFRNVLSSLDDLICGRVGIISVQQFFKDLDISFPEKIDLLVQYLLLKIGTETDFYKPHTKFDSLKKSGSLTLTTSSFVHELLDYKATLLKIPGLNEQIGMSYFLNKITRVT